MPGKANVVIGMRRAGKTFYCYQQMQALGAAGVAKERLLYLNFEDERLLPFTAADFQEVLDTYYRQFPAFKKQTCHFFLDEVQRVAGWESVTPLVGAVASALIAARLGQVGSPVLVHTRGGEVLTVTFRTESDSLTDVFLEGEALVVYQGELWTEEIK